MLLYFNTRCSFSRASVERWKQLARELGPAGGTHVVGISLDSAHLTPQYVKEHALNYPVVHFPGENARFTYRAQTVPVTIVVRPDGFVTHVRQGAVETAAARDSLIGAAEWTADRWAEIRNESAGGEKVEEAPRDGSSGSG